MIDLHIHTLFSDGTDDIDSILEKCEKAKLQKVSITDHDCVEAYFHIQKPHSITLIPGVEVKTVFEGVAIEILGYGIDYHKFAKSPCVNKQRSVEIQNRYLQNYIKVGKKLGIVCSDELKITDSRQYAAVIYYDEIIKYKDNFKLLPQLYERRENFYRTTMGNKESPFYINELADSLPIDFVISEIHRCGGLAFLAHLYQYTVSDHISFLKKILDSTEIDGCEAYYTTFTQQQTNTIIDICRAYQKLISGGTDYHGQNKKGIQLGIGYGDLQIPDVTVEWEKTK